MGNRLTGRRPRNSRNRVEPAPPDPGRQPASTGDAFSAPISRQMGDVKARFGIEFKPKANSVHYVFPALVVLRTMLLFVPPRHLTGGRHEESCISVGVGGRWLELGWLLRR